VTADRIYDISSVTDPYVGPYFLMSQLDTNSHVSIVVIFLCWDNANHDICCRWYERDNFLRRISWVDIDTFWWDFVF